MPSPSCALTERERSVLGLMAEGTAADAVAAQLGLSAISVRRHLRAAAAKLLREAAATGATSEPDAPPRRVAPRRAIPGRTMGHEALARALARHMARASRMGVPLVVLMVLGPPSVGAEHRPLALALALAVRQGDVVLPAAGEGYLVVLSAMDDGAAIGVAARLRGLDPRVSVGVARWRPGEGAQALLRRAGQLAARDDLCRRAERSLGRAAGLSLSD